MESRIFENYGRGNHGLLNGCVDRENRVFFNRRGSYGCGNRDCLIGVEIIIVNLSIRLEMSEVSKMKLLKV